MNLFLVTFHVTHKLFENEILHKYIDLNRII